MKTACNELIEKLVNLSNSTYFNGKKSDCDIIDKIKNIVNNEFVSIEKQQHEKTAIHITNVLMDALDNPKGGKFSGEDEFNKYWDKTYNV